MADRAANPKATWLTGTGEIAKGLGAGGWTGIPMRLVEEWVSRPTRTPAPRS